MKKYLHIIMFLAVIIFVGSVLGGLAINTRYPEIAAATQKSPVTVAPVTAPETQFSKQYIAALDVARVFGRAPGCADADPRLVDEIATEALAAGLDPRVLAATVAIESACNQYATSPKGAIGFLQVMPRVWKGTYDFEKQYNLLNLKDNLRVGTEILAGYVKQYGLANGLHHYNGLGSSGCDVCDTGYADKILALAARK
jgi:Transglycosylase SLT domain